MAGALAVPAAAPAHPGHGPSLVGVGGERFNPGVVRVAPGDRVTWVWNEPEAGRQHTVTADPNQAESFDSDPAGVPLHRNGDAYSHEFTQLGRFTYFCRVHPQTMRGTVEVTPPDRTAPQLSNVRANGRTWRIRFRVSEQATIYASVRRRGRVLRRFELLARAGANRRRLPVLALRPRLYRLRLVADDGAGNRSPAAFAGLRVPR